MPEPSTALITGASAGLGAEFARQLAARGDRLILVARRRERLEALGAELEAAHGIEVHVLTADLAESSSPQRLFDEVGALGLQVDVLVNNAGTAGPDLLKERDWERQAAFFQLMMGSVAHLCHLFIPPMQERGHGRVINVASFAGRISRKAGANYGPAKAWMIALSEELALIGREHGVHVTALCPGFVHTEFHAAGGMEHVKQKLPGWLWYEADVVVREGLDAVEAGRSVQVSGRLYRFADLLVRTPLLRAFIALAAR